MSKTPLKTSAEWLNTIQAETGDTIEIRDPDGWDRKNYDFSFNQEEISRQEFDFRLMQSTVMMKSGDEAKAAKAA